MNAERRGVKALGELLRSCPADELPDLIAGLAADERPGVAAAVRSARSRLREHERLDALHAFEDELRDGGAVAIAGADEVGRGAVAGPLTVAACVLPAGVRIQRLDDSKRLSPAVRSRVADCVRAQAVCLSVMHVPAAEVDGRGIAGALRHAMVGVIESLPIVPDRIVIDGLPLGLFETEIAVVKGDSRVAAVSAASVVAKVARDQLMVKLASEYPGYGFEQHKGYGTAEHFDAIRTLGATPEHRRTFLSEILSPTLF